MIELNCNLWDILVREKACLLKVVWLGGRVLIDTRQLFRCAVDAWKVF